MSAFFALPLLPIIARIAPVPAFRGRTHFSEAGPYALGRLATDSVGNFSLSLTNVVVGSSWRVEVQSTGALIDSGTAAASTVTVTVPVYASGSALNDLRIKVRKGTAAPKYIPFETQAVASVGAGSTYIAQVADTIAS